MVAAKRYIKGHRSSKKMVCRVCLEDHPLRFCKKFLQVDFKERMHLVSIYKYCAGCLSHDHTWQNCESTGKCRRCGEMHHTLLHKPGKRPRSSNLKGAKQLKRLDRGRSMSIRPSSSENSARGTRSSTRPMSIRPSTSENSARGPRSSNGQESERPSSSRALVLCKSRNQKTTIYRAKRQKRAREDLSLSVYQLNEAVILKPTAIIKLVAGERYVFQRALIDPGAECYIVSEEVAHRIGAKMVRVGNKIRCLIAIRGNHGSSVSVEVRRRHNVLTPKKSVDGKKVDEFPGLQLADPQFHVSSEVQITLGGDVYSRIIRNGVMGGSFGKPLAQFTIFGYIISGSCHT